MKQMNQWRLSQILSICSTERPLPAPARLVDSQPSIQEPPCCASPPTSKHFPSAPPWCWGLRCLRDRSMGRPSCCRRKVMSRRRLWPRSKTRVPAVPTTKRTWSPGSNREQRAPRTPAMAPIPSQPTPATTLPRTASPPPSTRSKTPTSTAPAVYISAAFPTTPATPTLPFAPTARTRSVRHHSRSTNTNELPKRAALRSSPSSTAWAAPAKRSPVRVPSRSVKASAGISPPRRMAPAALRLYSGPEPLQPLPPHRLVALRRKRQSQESPHRHALSQRDGHAAV